ncbi:sensor histidine kinase [Maribacter hydrothermalis]|uniref:histidine kinase n=1 Tax=Maribacter hydrothermalis TaxID=1836467 RepID=A0A1B7ZEZ4_9FLAO|nr:sensor histidine kinase [Maribacter hydrothermalis]APQ17638.1 histidine kinase [Maribacter hydrothermalis]OBR42113.1 histidine kinase [Maribacter hydrothermalis]
MNSIDLRYFATIVFTAIFCVFGIYHFVSYLVLRYKILKYYFILILGLTLHWSLYLIINNSFSAQIVFIADKASLTTAMITTFGLLMFTKNYLNISENNFPILFKIYKIFTTIIIGLPVAHILNNLITKFDWLNDVFVMFAAMTAMSSIFLNIFSGIQLYKTEKFNRYYLFSYAPCLLSAILYISSWYLKRYVDFDANLIVLITSILVTLQLILFSILVGYKFKTIEEDSLKIQMDVNKILISEVEKQTKHLQIAKEDLINQNEELEKINKLKNKLFSLLTHDVRGPLNNVNSIIEMIESQLEESELKVILKKLKNEVNDRVSMINVLLEWSYKQLEGVTLNKKLCDLEVLFKSIKKEFKRMADDKAIEIELDITCRELVIDENMLKVMLRNLTSNAIKFSEKGQKIILSSQCTSNIVELRVKDFGLGMNANWDNTSKNKNSPSVREGTHGEKGTGFGLMITKDFAEMNNGEVLCKSEPNRGTEFILRFRSSTNESINPLV